jgi:drug/metabolite transporter (DMT)-like permease
MDPLVFAAVLFAAACHAGWNAVIKVGMEPLATTVLIALGAGIVALVLWPVVGLPTAAAWPWLIASMVVHLAYFAGLIESYRAGDLGQVYPLARGSAPLLTAAASALLLREFFGLGGWAGIALLSAGVILLSLRGGRGLAQLDRRAVGFALFTAVTICTYSLVDGMGARVSHDPHAYAVALFVGNAAAVVTYGVVRRGTGIVTAMAGHWKMGLGAGVLTFVAYAIVIWAMTVAPIALVAALRETSVLFGAVIAVVVLKEPLRAARIIAALMIVAGLVLIRLQ